MKSRFARSWLVAALAGLAGLVTPVQGDIILVDFGTVAQRHALGVADANGNWWDYITGATDNNLDLVDSAGNATAVDLALSGFTGGGPGTYNAGLTPNAGLNGGVFAFTNVTDDAIFFTATDSPVMTLSGLNAAQTYSLTFYGARVSADDRWTTYAVGASSAQLQTSGAPLAGNWNSANVVTLAGLTPDINNQIVINLSASTGGSGTSFGYINAMQIEVVPEPGVAAFVVLGGVMMGLGRRFRRSRQA